MGRHFKPLNGNVKSQYCIFVLFFGQRFFNVWLFSFHRRIVHCAVGLLLLHGNNTYWMNLFCQAGYFYSDTIPFVSCEIYITSLIRIIFSKITQNLQLFYYFLDFLCPCLFFVHIRTCIVRVIVYEHIRLFTK